MLRSRKLWLALAGCWILGTVVLSCTQAEPCDGTCQETFFLYFQELHICDDVCGKADGETVQVVKPPSAAGEPATPVKLGNQDCGKCLSAWSAWTQGKDCNEGAIKCGVVIDAQYPRPLLQKCLQINNRLTWTFGRECEDDDEYPCVVTATGPLCYGCSSQEECSQLMVPGLKNQPSLTCIAKQQTCIQCNTNDDCPSYRSCVDSQCVGCTEDSHCSPSATGRYCSSELRCVCSDDESCLGVGFLSCRPTGRCKPCKTDKDCTASFDENSTCQKGRCLSACESNTDCQHYTAATCKGGRCLPEAPSCETDKDCARFGDNVKCHEERCTKTNGAPCKTNEDCKRFGPGTACQKGKCVRGGGEGGSCSSDDDCRLLGPNGRCQNNRCIRLDASCTTHEECQKLGSELRCNQGRCSFERPPPCQSDSDCDTNKCANGRCVPDDGCQTDKDCAAISPTSRCLLNRCIQPPKCKADADCAKDGKQGKCVAGTCVASGGCRTHTDCIRQLKTTNARCVNGVCQKTNAPPRCRDNKVCVEQLGQGARCVNGACQKSSATACTRDLQCVQALGQGARCVGGVCQKPDRSCSTHTECVRRFGQGFRCVGGLCQKN